MTKTVNVKQRSITVNNILNLRAIGSAKIIITPPRTPHGKNLTRRLRK